MSEMLMEHYCDVLNGLVKVWKPAICFTTLYFYVYPVVLRPRISTIAFPLRPPFSLYCCKSSQAAFYAEDKVAAKVCPRTMTASSNPISPSSQAKFFESDAPYFIGQLSKVSLALPSLPPHSRCLFSVLALQPSLDLFVFSQQLNRAGAVRSSKRKGAASPPKPPQVRSHAPCARQLSHSCASSER
jgi:hypothetical protein